MHEETKKDKENAIRIETIKDIVEKVPIEKLEDFIFNLHELILVQKNNLEYVKKYPGLVLKYGPVFWIDDDKDDIFISLTIENKNKG